MKLVEAPNDIFDSPVSKMSAKTAVSVGFLKGMIKVVLEPVLVYTLTGAFGRGRSPVPEATNTHSPS